MLFRSVCAGTMKAFVDGDLGDFARALAREVELELEGAPGAR